MRLALAILALAALAAPAAAQNLILPGVSVGPVHSGVTEAELRAMLPQGQVRRTLRLLPEGYATCVTEIYADTPRALLVSWIGNPDYDLSQAGAREACLALPDQVQPSLVYIPLLPGTAMVWQTREGIGVGMTLTALDALLGGPIVLLACPCDYGGYIRDDAGLLPPGLELSAEFPTNTYSVLVKAIDIQQDYALAFSDIPPHLVNQFFVREITVEIASP